MSVAARTRGPVPTPSSRATVQPPASSTERDAVLALECVCDDLPRRITHGLRGTTHGTVEHGASIRRPVGAYPENLEGQAIVKVTGYRSTRYRHAADLPRLINNGDRELVPSCRPMMSVVVRDERVRSSQTYGPDSKLRPDRRSIRGAGGQRGVGKAVCAHRRVLDSGSGSCLSHDVGNRPCLRLTDKSAHSCSSSVPVLRRRGLGATTTSRWALRSHTRVPAERSQAGSTARKAAWKAS